MQPLTRRTLLAILAAGAGRAWAGGAAPGRSPAGYSYRVDATVLLLSIPVFTRTGVGSGYARHRGTRGAGIHEFEFAAGSVPERAHGLNRMGMIRESVSEAGEGIEEAHYFGFMTASGEENLAEARKALEKHAATSTYVAIEGQSRAGMATCRKARFEAETGSMDWPRLIEKAELACKEAAGRASEERVPCGHGTLPTFLYALYRAIDSARPQEHQTFTYSRDRYELTTRKDPDARTGQRLAERGLPVRAESVVRLTGTIRNQRAGSHTPFRLWVEEGSAVPLRIEYQPRGFLQLALEAVPA